MALPVPKLVNFINPDIGGLVNNLAEHLADLLTLTCWSLHRRDPTRILPQSA
jgi:hypothetical protein